MIVSIAMTVFNGERFLTQQLQSLFDQSRQPNQIIITDDSADNACGQIIHKFELKYPGVIEYSRNPQSLGVNANFALAISKCRGDIIFLCDQDDIWLPEKISKMLMCFDSENVGGVFCNSAFIDAAGCELRGTLFEMRHFDFKAQRRMLLDGSFAVFAHDVYASGHNMAFRSEHKSLILPFPELPGLFEDTWIGLAISAISEWVWVDECLTLYRRHEVNQSSTAAGSLFEQVNLSRRALQKGHLQGKLNAVEAIKNRVGLLSAEKQKILTNLFKHCHDRQSMSSHVFVRFFKIARMLLNGGYFRFSNGWKSVLVDLFLR